jgi:L-amino acid N-acyltransferase YncA
MVNSIIRKIKEPDLAAVNEIYNQAVRSKYQTAETEETSLGFRQQWYEEHFAGQYPVFVFEEDGEVTGWISLSEYRKGRRALRYTAEVSFYVRSERQGQGIGTQLLAYVIDRAREIRIKTLIAILLEPNTPSIRLLEKFHFQKWGDMPNVADFDGIECNHQYFGLRIDDIRDQASQVP